MMDTPASVSLGLSPYGLSGTGEVAVPRYAPTCRTLTPSPSMRAVWDLVDRIAPTNSAVLIRGESGVGKETVAREIHRKSGRAGRGFVRLACGAIREDQLDAQLFGRKTHQPLENESSSGLLGRSDKGTLFLNGILDLPAWAQIKLLDALQQNEYQQFDRNGAGPDVRLIAATTCDIETAVAEGRFHAGLYYYVNVVEVRVPPLRERPEDVRPLAESFLLRLGPDQNQRPGGLGRRFSEEAWQRLLQYDWPGNARELASVVAHAAMVSDSVLIGPASVQVSMNKARCQRDSEAISVPLFGGLKEIERSVVGTVIERCGGNKAKAARVLGLHRRTLYRLLQDRVKSHAGASTEPASLGEDL